MLGPLVVGGFSCPSSVLDELPSRGIRDSKLLSPGRRSAIYRDLSEIGRCHAIALAPSVIDRRVRRGELNDLEVEVFARLVRTARPSAAFVDACDVDARRFGERVGRLSGRIARIDARHHADRTNPLVGAASIVAKVVRDRAIETLRVRLGAPIGSGYPGDPKTIAFLRATFARGGRTPGWVRASWATTRRLKREVQVVSLERFDP